MTEQTETNDTSAAPAFDAIPVADLPTPTKGASPERLALGTALLGALTAGQTAAGDRERFADRKDASKRAAVLRRAITAAGGVPKGTTFGTQIAASAEGFYVIARLDKTSK